MKGLGRATATLVVATLALVSCSSGGGTAAPEGTIQAPSRFCLLWGDWHDLRLHFADAGNALQAQDFVSQLPEKANELVEAAPEDVAADVAEMQAAATEMAAVNQELLAYVNNEGATPPDLTARAAAASDRLEALDTLPIAFQAFQLCGADDAADPTFELPCDYDRQIDLPPHPRPFVPAVPDPNQVVGPYVEGTPGATQAILRDLPEDLPEAPPTSAPPDTAAGVTVAPAPPANPRAHAVEVALVDADGKPLRLVVLSPVDNDWVETASFTCG